MIGATHVVHSLASRLLANSLPHRMGSHSLFIHLSEVGEIGTSFKSNSDPSEGTSFCESYGFSVIEVLVSASKVSADKRKPDLRSALRTAVKALQQVLYELRLG